MQFPLLLYMYMKGDFFMKEYNWKKILSHSSRFARLRYARGKLERGYSREDCLPCRRSYRFAGRTYTYKTFGR